MARGWALLDGLTAKCFFGNALGKRTLPDRFVFSIGAAGLFLASVFWKVPYGF